VSGWRVERVSGLQPERKSALERGRWIIYKVTTEADVMKLVAAEALKRSGGGGR
jgi:hypothetical protein